MATASREFYSRQTVNPLPVLADVRVATTAGGTLTAYMGRKLAYRNYRGVFGHAVKTERGVEYFAVFPEVNKDGTRHERAGQVDTDTKIPNALVNRLLYNGANVVGGALIVGYVRDPAIDYFGVGVIAGSLANVVMTLLNID